MKPPGEPGRRIGGGEPAPQPAPEDSSSGELEEFGPAKRLADILGEQATPASVRERAEHDAYRGRAEIIASPLRDPRTPAV